MSLSNIWVKILGVLLSLLGLFMVYTAVIAFAFTLNVIALLVVGLILIGVGIYVIGGGVITA